MDKLYFLSGPLQGATAELIGDEITIGRASDNGICIDDESVSDHHAVIARQNKECILRDLQSARGTTVQGNKVIVVTLEDSNRIAFGAVEAEFTTTEIKLHMPTTAVLPPSPQQIAWPQRKDPSAGSVGSSFKSAVLTLVQLVALVALAGGGYFVYQKFSKMDPNGDALPTDNAKATPLATTSRTPAQAPHYTAAASLPPTPQPYAVPAASATQSTMPAQPAPAAAPVSVAAPAPARIVSASSNPAIQQAKLLLAQNKYSDAVNYLDKVIATTKDPSVAADAQVPLKQALDAQLLSLQSIKQQWEAQSKPLEERLKAAQDKVNQDTKALEDKKAAEAKVYVMPGGHWRSGYWDGVYYSSRGWVPNTRKGTGDPQAQTAIHELQIKVMTSTQEVKKQTGLVNRYRQQVLALEQQIAPIQARIAQLDAVLKLAQPATPPQPEQAASASK
ncbi:MAG: FHA domain-containing protein [Verrucomicrobia bacterium]|nr:FHA domain-containing protein [Verrucomicrobiota bacterium]